MITLIGCSKSKQETVGKCLLQANKIFPTDMTQKSMLFQSCMVKYKYAFNAHNCDKDKQEHVLSEICPELIAYRNKLDERQRLQIEGGKKGALRKKEKEVTSSYPDGIPEGSLGEHNLIENNLIKHTTKEQVFREEQLAEENSLAEHKEWIEEMDKAESYF